MPQNPFTSLDTPVYCRISRAAHTPTQTAKVFTANLNGTVTVFEFEELK